MLNRAATSLVELLVAIALASVVLATATSSMLRQQRTHVRVAGVSATDGQVRAATSVLASHLAQLEPGAGDVVAGESSDTAVQFRAIVELSLACDKSVGSVTMLPDTAAGALFTGSASAPRAGDTLWRFSTTGWLGSPIGSTTVVAATCASPIPVAGRASRLVLPGAVDSISPGTPLRVTRQSRYGVYRASDGSWQLGFREWNDPAGAFSAPQPVAGPLVRRIGSLRSGFRYFDSSGAELDPADGPVDVRRAARIRITMLSLLPTRERVQDSIRIDSVDVAPHLTRGSPPS
ncbi:MAG: hypothetical protein ABJA80_04865 [bacterium]